MILLFNFRDSSIMDIYLVGGAVRDQLLGVPVKEKDWVVVGARPADLLRLGFKCVGKDFPVFLHPVTQEEYALARKERKTAAGYAGFVFEVAPTVTLEEDLRRRDLTINAMAQAVDGELIDPYHGRLDIEKKILRHVSAAFVEDPVRVLRVARFAARYAHLGFTIAPETLQLMQRIVRSGEINALTPERVWKELERALSELNPEIFFHTLMACGANAILFPMIDQEGLRALIKAAATRADSKIRWAALLHAVSVEEVRRLSKQFRIPNDYSQLAELASRYVSVYQQPLSAEDILQLFYSTDAFRREERFKQFLTVCAICTDQSAQLILHCLAAIKTIDIKKLSQELVGKKIAEKLYAERLLIIRHLLKE